jgi:hypothetical protein
MLANHIIYQYVKVSRALPAPLAFLAFCLIPAVHAQLPKPSLPDPVKFLERREKVMSVSRDVLEQMGLRIELFDPKGGRLVTRPFEFVSGALTSGETDKVAAKSDTVTGSWLRARYSVEALFELVGPGETLLTVRTNIEALNREIDGTEKWVTLQSLGSVEKRILGKISLKLLGVEPEFKDNKGFWDQKPKPVPTVKKAPSS